MFYINLTRPNVTTNKKIYENIIVSIYIFAWVTKEVKNFCVQHEESNSVQY